MAKAIRYTVEFDNSSDLEAFVRLVAPFLAMRCDPRRRSKPLASGEVGTVIPLRRAAPDAEA